MVDSFKLIDVGRNMLTSIPNMTINATKNTTFENRSDYTLIAEYGICIPEQENQNIQMSGSFGINVPLCEKGLFRIMTTTTNKTSKDIVTYFMDYSLNNNSDFPKYKLINFNTLLDKINYYGYRTHKLYIISNVSVTLLGPITFQGLLYATNQKITQKVNANSSTINRVIDDNLSSTVIPFSSGDDIIFSNGYSYLTSYGNYIALRLENISHTEIEINEPYGAFCVPRKSVYSGISCKFVYKGSDTYYPLGCIKIKIYIYVNNPKNDNMFKKISEHTVGELDHGDCVSIGQILSTNDNNIDYVIDEGNRILPIFSIEFSNTDSMFAGQYYGSILLK